MKRELWLLRHAKSVKDEVMEDLERPLQERGLRDAKKIGAWMHKHRLMPDYLISSPAKRALTTAEIVCEQIGLEKNALHQDSRLYFEGINQIKCVLSELPDTRQKVLLVGHNPDFEDLLKSMVGKERMVSIEGKVFPTATLIRLAMPKQWHELGDACAQLLDINRP